MKKLSLKMKLISGGAMSIVMLILIVGVFSVTLSEDALEESAHSRASLVARQLAGMTDHFISQELKLVEKLSVEAEIRTLAQGLTSSDGISTLDVEVVNASLAAMMKKIGSSYEGVLVTGPDGKVVADGIGGGYLGLDLGGRAYFQKARDGKAGVDEPVISKSTGRPVLPIAAAIEDRAGRFAGVVSTVLKMDALMENIVSTKIGETGYPFLADKGGLILIHPKAEHILKLDISKLDGMKGLVSKAAASSQGIEGYTFNGTDKISAWAGVGSTGWNLFVTQDAEEFLSASRQIRNVIALVGVVFLAVAMVTILLFVRTLTVPITRIIDNLSDGAGQVAAASGQVSAAGQSLAAGSAQQAAGIEETSSSLEEMSAMTRQNADHAREADTLMTAASEVVAMANKEMGELTSSMDQIQKSSEETSKIIKTIDEIAFQTNLLALNAAVEAARAGEAGAGFAVVADEVRNLAMRAAEAAKNTSELIEGSVKQIQAGTEYVNRTNDSFTKVAEHSKKVGELISEIAAASKEQAEGIVQVNQAVSEMDKVVQSNAANAEESASAAEEMSAQAEEMNTVVVELGGLIYGSASNARAKETPAVGDRLVKSVQPESKTMIKTASEKVAPAKAIPFDDQASFTDF